MNLRYWVILIPICVLTIAYFLLSAEHGIHKSHYFCSRFIEEEANLSSGLFRVYRLNVSFGQTASGLATADFNHDGLLDFAVSYATKPFNYSAIAIFYNQGNLTFKGKVVIGFNYSYIVDLDAGDYDQDGDIDLIFTFDQYRWYNGLPYYVNGSAILALNDGSDHFRDYNLIIHKRSKRIDLEESIHLRIASGDYDGDGDLDIAVGSNSGEVELRFNDNLSFNDTRVIKDLGAFSRPISTDFDGDGRLDLIVVSATSTEGEEGHIYFFRNEGAPRCFTNCRTICDISGYPGTGALASMGNGKIDFILGIEDGIYILERTNTSSYTQKLLCRLPPYRGHLDAIGDIVTGDFNNDGHMDFIVGGIQGIIRLFLSKA